MPIAAVDIVVTLLVIATVVAVVAKSMRVPYTVALVICGLGISLLKGFDFGFLKGIQQAELSKELILLIFLPPLLFEGTINMDLEILRRNKAPVAVLALIGTLVATGLIGISLSGIFGLGIVGAMLIGSILAPTDPVSVIAVFKEQGVNKNLATIVEGESVFNDGIGVVLYLIFVQLCTDATNVTFSHAVTEFLREILIGGGIGVGLGYLAHWVLGRIDDRFTEVMISVALAYGVYVISEHLHASGVIAVVTAGLIIGNYGKVLSMSPTTRFAMTSFWEAAAFIVNSLLFLLMGLECDILSLHAHWFEILVAFGLMIVVRALLVYTTFGILNRFRPPVSRSWQHVVNWGGLRGSIPVALVLGLPTGLSLVGPEVTWLKADVTQLVFGVVMLSLLTQGLTMNRLLSHLGFTKLPPHEREYDLLRGRTISVKAALVMLEDLFDKGEVASSIYTDMHRELDRELGLLSASTSSVFESHDALHDSEYRKIADALLLSQRAALEDASRQGLLTEEATDKLVHDIDEKLASDGNPFYGEDETNELPPELD